MGTNQATATESPSNETESPFTPHTNTITDDYELSNEALGEGASGKVFKCQHRATKKNCALKILIDSDKARQEVIMHRKACKKFDYIVKVLDVYLNTRESQRCLFIVMECMEGGELFDRIKQRETNPYTERDAARFISMIVKAVAHLHGMDMAHRDLKPENLLLTSKDNDAILKLTDFGFAKEGNNELQPLITPCYTEYYVAPEILSHSRYDKACDIWSMGVIMYILLCGYPPFYPSHGGKWSAGMARNIKAGEYEFYEDDWEHVSEEAKSTIKRMLTVIPTERITIDEILNCSWLAEPASERLIDMSSLCDEENRNQIQSELASANDNQRRADDDLEVKIRGPEASLNSTLPTKAFADVKELSYFKTKNELLITLRTLFRIDEINENPQDHVHNIKVSLASEDDYRLKEMFAYMKNKIGNEITLDSLGKILQEMGEYQQALKCYKRLTHETYNSLGFAYHKYVLPSDHPDIGFGYDNLGIMLKTKKQYVEALRYLNKSLEISLRILPLTHADVKRHRLSSSVIFTAGRGAFHQSIGRLKEKYGDLFSIRIGRSRITIVSRTDFVRHILADRNTYEISETTNRNFSLIFPEGLLSVKGDTFKRHARVMLPMYRKSKTLPYFDNIVECIDRLIEEEFMHQDRRIHTDLVIKCQHVLLNIIAVIGFDYDLNKGSAMDADILRQAFNDVIKCANRFALMAGIPMWIARIQLSWNFKFQQALRTLKHYVMRIINEEQQRQGQREQPLTRPKSLIASMVAAAESDRLEMGLTKASLTPTELFDEVSLSMVAGFETTSTALSWFFFLMSKYPDVQGKIKEELHHHDLTSNAMLSPEHLDQLIYVDCVMKEILRYAPVAAAIVRQATRDDVIKDVLVKKGDIFLIATQNMHKDSRYWNIDPLKFVPERFLGEDKNPPACAYMPFGGGHRACIGQDLALFEFKIAITRLMQRITIEDAGKEADNSGGFIQRITCFPKHVAVRVYLDAV